MTPPVPDSKSAVEFLKKYSKQNPIVLTAIAMGKNPKIYGVVVKPKVFAIIGKDFIEKHNGKANIYFSVNPIKPGLDIKKAKKKDLHLLSYLHIDLDPEVGKSLEGERKRILTKLTSFVPEPTIIIDSGGGYQGFWKLEPPVQIKDTEALADLERYNIQLALLLGGDACHNADRIMRLPGTINIPTPTKIKKGRVEVLAKLVHFKEKLTYDIKEFKQATVTGPVSKEKPKPFIKEDMKGDINIDSDSLDVLPISERIKVLIIHGEDPEETDRWPSRSECHW